MCEELKEALKRKPFFDCVGGCGVDLSNGTSNCMGTDGAWFKYCPFCGKKIVATHTDGMSWEWHEE